MVFAWVNNRCCLTRILSLNIVLRQYFTYMNAVLCFLETIFTYLCDMGGFAHVYSVYSFGFGRNANHRVNKFGGGMFGSRYWAGAKDSQQVGFLGTWRILVVVATVRC